MIKHPSVFPYFPITKLQSSCHFAKPIQSASGGLLSTAGQLIAVLRRWLFEVDLNLYAARLALDKSWSQFLCVGRYRVD